MMGKLHQSSTSSTTKQIMDTPKDGKKLGMSIEKFSKTSIRKDLSGLPNQP